jgi:peptide deformylase
MSFDIRAAAVEIVKAGHPALRSGTWSVSQELFDTPALHELIDVMRAALAGKGVGRAAPQIAVPLRLFVAEDTQDRMSHLIPEQQKARKRYPFPSEEVSNPTWYAASPEMVSKQRGISAFPALRRMSAVTGRSRLKDFSRMASGKLGPSKDGRHVSFNMKSITLTDGYLPIACFQERSHRRSRTVQVLRPTYSNASPFPPNRPRKNERHSAPDRTCALA